jgi:hypothetical protein
MLSVEFEPTIPEFKRAKTVHALDRTTTVMGVGYRTTCGYASEDITLHNLTRRFVWV